MSGFTPIPNFTGPNAGQLFRAAVNALFGGQAPSAIVNTVPNGSSVPLTGTTVVIPDFQQFTAIIPAGALAALTVQLSLNALSGFPTEIFIGQAITSLTVSAPGGLSISGSAITAAASRAGLVLAYRRQGSIWYRTK